LENLVSEV